jgi:dephospho-CoA kinase
MFVVGLTGGIGSGKTTVANLFAKKGITIIDTDQLARDVIEAEPLQKIVKKFGPQVLSADGNLNRSELREIIFNDEKEKIWLEKLLHPLIIESMHQKIKTAESPYCIAIIPLLFETGPYPILNRILVIDATVELQIERAYLRDNVSRESIQKILKSQISREYRLKHADDVIQNTGNLKDLSAAVDRLHERYITLSTR